MNILEVKDLDMSYKTIDGEVEAVKKVTFSVKEGESFGIVGESGSGKSTLALAMMGYTKQGLYTISGQCLFKSKNLLNMTDRDLEKIRGKDARFQDLLN